MARLGCDLKAESWADPKSSRPNAHWLPVSNPLVRDSRFPMLVHGLGLRGLRGGRIGAEDRMAWKRGLEILSIHMEIDPLLGNLSLPARSNASQILICEILIPAVSIGPGILCRFSGTTVGRLTVWWV